MHHTTAVVIPLRPAPPRPEGPPPLSSGGGVVVPFATAGLSRTLASLAAAEEELAEAEARCWAAKVSHAVASARVVRARMRAWAEGRQ